MSRGADMVANDDPEDAPVKTILALLAAGLLSFGASAHAAPGANRVEIAYQEPDNPAHSKIYADLRENRVLERLQEFLSPFKLVIPVEIVMEQVARGDLGAIGPP